MSVNRGVISLPNYYKVKKSSESELSNQLTTELASLVGNVRVQDSQRKIALIQGLVDEECWLACDCGNTAKYLFPVQKENSFHFRRRSSDDVHCDDCFFKNLKSINFGDSDLVTLPPKSDEIFDLCKKSGVSTPNENDRGNNLITRTVRLSKLGRLLLHAITKAELNVQSNERNETVYEQFSRLVNSFEKIHYDKNHAISDILFTSFDYFNKTQEKLHQLEQNWTSKKTDPHGFILTLINKITRNEKNYLIHYLIVDTDSQTISKKEFTIYNSYFKSEPKKINGYISLENSGPWLGLFLIRKTKQYDNNPNSVNFLPVRAFLYPVHSDENIFPIESGKERKVLSKIIELLNYNKNKNKKCEVEKALYSMPNDDEEVQLSSIQPDFFIRSRSTCVLEVMGIMDEEYTLRKVELNKYYRNKNIPFVELDATCESNELDEEVNNKVKSAFLSAIR